MTTTPATAAFHGCGAAYDPAFWAPALWPEHVRLMRECGIRFVRLFEFSWSHFEARPGVYDFGWSDDFLALLDEAGIGFLLCTPGATPPRWLTHKHPEALVMHADGRRDRGEVRRHGCPNSPAFMGSALDLTRLLAERYGRRPGLLGWQIDNEFGHPVCHCPLCQADFRGWLQEEFGSLEEVNRRLGMVVWSRDFSHWDEVQIPVGACPQLHHAFRRYTSQLWQRYARLHVEALRPFTDRPISTNMMAPWHGYDHYELAPLLDVVGMDYYPYADASQVYSYQLADVEFNLAYTRAIAGGQPFWLLETSLTAGRQIPPRGRLAEWTWRQIAHGANLLNFFRWDTPPFGGEEADFGLVGPGTWTPPYFSEVTELCHQVQRLAPLLAGSVPQRAEVGVLFSYPSWWKHLDAPPCRRLSPHPMHGYPLLVIRHCHGLLENGVAFDLLGPEQPWEGYRWLVVPHCAVMPPALLARLAEFIRQGGSVLLTATSGLFDGDGCAHPAPYPPAPLGELFGIATGCQGKVVSEAGELTAAWPGAALVFHPEHWVDRLQLAEGTEVWMEYADPLYRSEPALTCRRQGKGQALYLGTAFPRAEMGALYGLLLGRVPVRPGPYQAGVCQRSRLTPDGREVRFLQNLTEVPAEINLEAPATDAFTGKPLPERFHLAGRTTRILVLAAPPAP